MTPVPGDGGPGPVPLAAPPARIQPRRIWYLVALVAFLGGVALLVVGLVSLSSQVDSFPRVAIPAGGQVSLSHPGGYVIYYEGPGAQSGHIAAFRVRVVPASPSAAVRTPAPYTTSVTYAFGSRQGRAVLTLQVVHPGRFRVETTGAGGLPGGSDLAFGHSIAAGITVIAVLSGLLVLAGLAGLAVILVIRIAKTRRARAEDSAAPAWSPPGPQP